MQNALFLFDYCIITKQLATNNKKITSRLLRAQLFHYPCALYAHLRSRRLYGFPAFNQPSVPTINVVVDMVAPQRRIAKIIGGEVDEKA